MTVKEHPILFSAPMVRALLDGSKTKTRRVLKPQPPEDVVRIAVENFTPIVSDKHGDQQPGPEIFGAYDMTGSWGTKCPHGQPGDRLWVRESWAPDPPCDGTWGYTEWAGCREGRIAGVPERFRHPQHCIYAATWKGAPLRWTPSIHMPRWASRITLDVTGVRVERLQDISDADSLAEGVDRTNTSIPGYAKERYRQRWESINGPGSWDENPWVWVIEFRRVNQ